MIEEKETVTISSTGWTQIDVEAISNFDSEIEIGERKFCTVENCYVRTIKAMLPKADMDSLYEVLKHLNCDCDTEVCQYCKLEDS